MRFVRIAMLAFVVLGVCVAPALAQGASKSVEIVDFTYNPVNFTVDPGTTITFTNHGGRPHTVTDRGGTFDTGPVSPGASGSVTLSAPGRYFFFCRINPSKMNGVIVVSGVASPKAVRVQAVDPARDLPLGFDPSQLSVDAGTPIVFANVGGKPHSFTADDGSFDSGIVTPGAAGGRFAGTNATVVVPKPGTYPFHCDVHPDAMKGVLTVTGTAREGPGAVSSAPNRLALTVRDFEFDPKEASVAPGGTVTWKNAGPAPHTATFDDVDLDTKTIQPGSDASLVAPAKPGNYSYRCNIHPAKMRGVLVVVAQGIADPTKTDYQKAAAATGSGSKGALPAVALITAVIGAFLGGFGVSAFVRNKPA